MYGLVAQLGERTVRIREVRGFDPLQVHHKTALKSFRFKAVLLFERKNLEGIFHKDQKNRLSRQPVLLCKEGRKLRTPEGERA